MSEVIPIEGKEKRGPTDIWDELDTLLRDIHTVADLLSVAESDSIGCNEAGYCLTRMIERAQKLHTELWECPRGVK